MDDLFVKSKADAEKLKKRIAAALSGPALKSETVINACGRLSDELAAPEYTAMLEALGIPGSKARAEISAARRMLSREYLSYRVSRELQSPGVFTPLFCERPVRQERMPLGVLLHVSAGNVDALPAFSVIEGLLAGNVNLLKLPREDNGLSAAILNSLCETEPKLAPFIEIFDVPSTDTRSLEALCGLADAVIVWGGDEAVKAVRRLAGPGTKLIEWGHKLSFAYASPDADESALSGIAENICATDQLFCSSCQGIFVDTDDFGRVLEFAERFADVLENAAKGYPPSDMRVTAQRTLEAYTEQLEGGDKRVLLRDGCCVTAYRESVLLPAHGFKSCWVRPLPRGEILTAMLPYRGRLQTVGLACRDDARDEAAELFLRAGAVRITDGRSMSEEYCGLPHDGELPLQRYTKVVSVETAGIE